MSEVDDPEVRPRSCATPRWRRAERTLAEILERCPTSPGVYLMKDRRGKVIYVGKAANLRARVRQYFQPATRRHRAFVPLLEGIVADIETVVTCNEKEALLLENTLIKQHQPRFNVKLPDDKNFLVLRLDARPSGRGWRSCASIGDDGAHYFGPYHSATACREALRVVNRHFQLRTCTDHALDDPPAPVPAVPDQALPGALRADGRARAYAEQVRDVGLFLEGKSDELLARPARAHEGAAAQTAFEHAATLRDQIRALEVGAGVAAASCWTTSSTRTWSAFTARATRSRSS